MSNTSNSVVQRIVIFILFVVVLSTSFPAATYASVANYRLVSSTGAALDMTGSTVLWQGAKGGRQSGLASSTINIGFNFVLDGVSYSQMKVYLSGVVSLGSGTLANNTNNTLVAANVPVIAGFWDALNITGGSGCFTPLVRYKLSGVAPNRIMTVDWTRIESYNSSESYISFQIRMYESGVIEFYYSSSCAQCSVPGGFCPSTSASIGFATAQNTFFSVTPAALGASTSTTSANDTINLGNFSIGANTLYTIFRLPNIQASVSPKFYDFGTVSVGGSATTPVTVTHAGTQGKLKINSVTFSGDPGFSLLTSPLPDSLAVGASTPLSVKFSRTAIGVFTTVMTIVTNGLDSGTQTVVLTAAGFAPTIAVDSATLFQQVAVKMGQSRTERVRISSTNAAPLFIGSLVISGIDSDQYRIKRFPSNLILGGATDSLFVTYTPTREGLHLARLTINSNAANAPAQQIVLDGKGILPHILVTPEPLNFDSVYIGDSATKQIFVTNTGSDTLVITANLFSSNDGDFHISPLLGSETVIPPDRTKIMDATFKPKQAGSRMARYFFRTNIVPTFELPPRDTASISVDLGGTGVPFGVLANTLGTSIHDTTFKGTQICTADTLRNTGGVDLTITSWNISGANASDFTMTGITLPYLLRPHASAVIHICSTPSDYGLRLATETITTKSNGKTQTLTVGLNVYGLKACDQESDDVLFEDNGVSELVVENSDSTACLTITNCGEVSEVYTAALDSAGSADYTLLPPTKSALTPPGSTATFCVKFHPTSDTVEVSQLKIRQSDVPDNLLAILTALRGKGACAAPTSTAATYPSNPGSGGHYTVTIPVTNSGNYPWTSGNGTLTQTQTPASNNAFSNVVVTPDPIPAGQQGTITINFDPNDLSTTYSGTLDFPGSTPTCSSLSQISISVQTGTAGVARKTEQNGFSLGQNYPNPFSLATTFNYTTPTEAPVSLTISDVTGHLVKTISTGRVSAGEHQVSIDATEFASGTYVVSLTSGSVTLSRQMVLTK